MNLAKTLETPGICRLAVAAAAVASAVCADGAITSQSYVAPGLVAQYDGIDNAGVGVHDDSAVTWVDLTGNGYDGTVTNAVGWLADGWTNSVNCKPVTLGNGISAITATGLYTIQFACTPARDDVRECFFSQYDSNIKSIGIEHNANGNTQGYLRFYSNAEGVGYLAQTQPFLKDAWAQGSITVTNGTKKVGFWKNGELLQSNTFESTDQKTYDACPSVIGGEPNTGRDMAFRGTYNAFRLYNRVLTEEEMKLNYAVDSVRFNGADWSDYPEFAGYTFDANGLLTVNFAVSADGNGTVSVNGGAAGASFADSFAYDGAAH